MLIVLILASAPLYFIFRRKNKTSLPEKIAAAVTVLFLAVMATLGLSSELSCGADESVEWIEDPSTRLDLPAFPDGSGTRLMLAGDTYYYFVQKEGRLEPQAESFGGLGYPSLSSSSDQAYRITETGVVTREYSGWCRNIWILWPFKLQPNGRRNVYYCPPEMLRIAPNSEMSSVGVGE